MPRGGHNRNTLDVFWQRVDKNGDCWLWQGRLGGGGYGHFDYQGKTWLAHRLAYWIEHGGIPDGMDILHHCDNPRCVRPGHLVAGTATDNMQDMLRKGRANKPSKERSGLARTTMNDVREIRRLYRLGATQVMLGKQFDLDQTTISLIVNNRTWVE
jgi:hypothetical protein